MKEVVIKETHYVVHADHPSDIPLEITAEAHYKILDDGFVTVDYQNVNYPVWGNA